MKKITETYHLIFDATGCERNMLDSEQFVFSMLMEIPKLIGMKILSGPNLIRDFKEDNAGITGFAIIDFSHVSIHTFTLTREAYIDVFSCRQFDHDKLRSYLYEKLNVMPENVKTLRVRYPEE